MHFLMRAHCPSLTYIWDLHQVPRSLAQLLHLSERDNREERATREENGEEEEKEECMNPFTCKKCVVQKQ